MTKKHLTNLLFILTGGASALSGMILQIGYHLRRIPDGEPVLLLNREAWNDVHIVISTGFLLILGYHLCRHRKWYKSLGKGIRPKQRPTALLSLLAAIAVIAGFMPLLSVRFSPLIEVHDKFALLFLIAAICHAAKRLHRVR